VESARLFEWVDGPLIEAMQKGDLFLADEISLADDSVLERLNSLLGRCVCMVRWCACVCVSVFIC
jgi:midasin (ATPase involved in ribosome maturation)